MCIVCQEFERKVEKLDRHIDAVADRPGAYCVVRREELVELRDFLNMKKLEFVAEAVEASGW